MKIGVTGIFASGKGTVCSMFEGLGSKVIDTDIIARNIVEPGSDGLKLLTDSFGLNILNPDMTLNRKALADIVFDDAEKVKIINEITHPLIFKKMSEIINKSPDDIYMINIPLLYETNADKLMDYTIVVFADTDQVINRGKERDKISEFDIKQRLNHQISLNEKIKHADYVIDNSGSILNTKRQVLEIWKILQQKKIK